jgi:hypothetical protein
MRLIGLAVVLAASLALAPLAAGAQRAVKVPRIGHLVAGPPQCKLAPRDEAFYQSLRGLGYIPGQNITVDLRCFRTADEMRKVLSEFVGSPGSRARSGARRTSSA